MQDDSLETGVSLLLTNKWTIVYQTLWPLNNGIETNYEEIMWKSKWIYQRTLTNKQENRYKKKEKKTYRDARTLGTTSRRYQHDTQKWLTNKRKVS